MNKILLLLLFLVCSGRICPMQLVDHDDHLPLLHVAIDTGQLNDLLSEIIYAQDVVSRRLSVAQAGQRRFYDWQSRLTCSTGLLSVLLLCDLGFLCMGQGECSDSLFGL